MEDSRIFMDVRYVQYVLSVSEVGGRECEPAPPGNQEIVSFRSCVRARGACHVIRNEKVRRSSGIFYRWSREVVSFSSGNMLSLGPCVCYL